jgi:hypothetical protein
MASAESRPRKNEISGSAIRLTDLKALETLAKPNPLIDDPTG